MTYMSLVHVQVHVLKEQHSKTIIWALAWTSMLLYTSLVVRIAPVRVLVSSGDIGKVLSILFHDKAGNERHFKEVDRLKHFHSYRDLFSICGMQLFFAEKLRTYLRVTYTYCENALNSSETS